MGKTYEALAVIAAMFRHNPAARIPVLTHSSAMANTWADRWNWFRERAVAPNFRQECCKGELLDDIGDLGRGPLGFASYDRLKRMPTHELRWALERCFEGRWLRMKVRRRLAWELLGTRVALTHGTVADKIPRGALDRIWRAHFESDKRSWRHPWSAWAELRRLVYRASRTKRRVDLLVVDEAHKVASNQRSIFFAEVLGSRARRALFVTATPFSLSIDQLHERTEDMHVVTTPGSEDLAKLWKELERFRDIVLSGGALPAQLKLGL